MTNSIYTVKNLKVGKLSKFEKTIYDILTARNSEIGDSISEKKLKSEFAKWNSEKMTVNVNTLINEKIAKKICLFFAMEVKNGTKKSPFIYQVRVNKAHGNFSLDVISSSVLNEEFTDKELSVKESIPIDVFEFLQKYINKNAEAITASDNCNDKINSIVAILEALKN